MRKITLILLVFIFTPLFSVSANGAPYSTYTYSHLTNQFVDTQDAYQQIARIQTLGDVTLSDPSDITIDQQDNIYIADRELGIVIKYNMENREVNRIGEGILKAPTGVHVGIDGHVYVTDFELKKAFQFAEVDNRYVTIKTYEKPVDSPFFTRDDPFDPTKIITDKANNVYILLAGNINGLAKYKNDGTFLGFFGGNSIPPSWKNVLTYKLFDEKTRRNFFQMIPDPVSNVAVDLKGLILTTTQANEGYLKLNIANLVYNRSVWGHSDVEDMFVGPYETVFTINKEGYIVEYGPDGSVLYIFSGTDLSGIQGLFQGPTGIAVDSRNNIYVIDNRSKMLQIFTPTAFADLVHQAILLYEQGRYIESLEPWQKVLQQNALFDLANKGLGDAYFAQMDYKSALYYYQIARDRQGYSDAFWEVRNQFLLSSATPIVLIIGGITLLFFANRFMGFRTLRRKPIQMLKKYMNKIPGLKQLAYPFYLFRSPINGFYGIAYEQKGSYVSATIYIFSFFVAYLFFIYETSFLFNPAIPSEIQIVEEIIKVFVPIMLFVIANYLVCSIREGEGRFKDVYIGTSYVLLPLIICLPIVTILSKGLTNNEGFIFNMLLYAAIGLSIFYLIFMVKEIHYYELKETIGNILLTIFTALMMVVVTFIVYLLVGEVVTLISDIIKEVIVRG